MSEVQVHVITPYNLNEMMEAAKAGDLELCGALDLANEFAGRAELCSQCRTEFGGNERPIVFIVIHDGGDAHTAGFCRRCAEDENFEANVDEQLAALGIVPAVLQ
jgi:hypothetical protein